MTLTHLSDESGEVESLDVRVGGDGVRAGHQPEGEGIGGQEAHDVLFLHVRPASEVDEQIAPVLPVAAATHRRWNVMSCTCTSDYMYMHSMRIMRMRHYMYHR